MKTETRPGLTGTDCLLYIDDVPMVVVSILDARWQQLPTDQQHQATTAITAHIARLLQPTLIQEPRP